MAKKKYKLGQKVIFVKSRVPFEEDQGVMNRHIGTVGTITEFDVEEVQYDYIVQFNDLDSYSVREDEICKVTKVTKVLYGL
jgi:hypothetical protein